MEFGKELLVYMTFLVVVTPLFVQAIKKTELIPSKWLPTVSIFVGAILGALAIFLDGSGSLATMVWAGALAGAGGTGLFEQFTNRAKKYGEDEDK
ncbi:holin [Listeria monocytogenes]|nr:holin [Listeria monocytogenes]